MNKLLSITAILLLCSVSFAQQFPTNTIELYANDAPIAMNGWQIYHETSNFRIEYNREDCDPSSGLDQEVIHFRFTNLSSNDIVLDWQLDLYYDGECKTCGVGEYLRNVTIPANQVIETDCENGPNAQYRLFSKFIDPAYSGGARLTAFQLNNLSLTTN